MVKQPHTAGFIGTGDAFEKLQLQIDQVAVSSSTVLLLGETGTQEKNWLQD